MLVPMFNQWQRPWRGGTRSSWDGWSVCGTDCEWWILALWLFVFVFHEFCVVRSFRTLEFVAATFVRRGRKQLPSWSAEGECAVVLFGRHLRGCIVWFHGGISVCRNIVLSATLFHLCIPIRDLRDAFWRGDSSTKMYHDYVSRSERRSKSRYEDL